jgi:hypothetical protein
MQLISELTYATTLEKNRIGSTTDRVALRGLIKTIDQLSNHDPAQVAEAHAPVVEIDSSHTSAADIVAELANIHAQQKPGSISVSLIGVNYRSAADHARAHAIISAVRADTLHPNLLIFERDLAYGQTRIPCPMIHEEALTTSREGNFGRGLTRGQRCMVVAGYIHLCIAAGEQSGIDRIVLFFDSHQIGILDDFKYFVEHTRSSPIKARPYTLFSAGAKH